MVPKVDLVGFVEGGLRSIASQPVDAAALALGRAPGAALADDGRCGPQDDRGGRAVVDQARGRDRCADPLLDEGHHLEDAFAFREGLDPVTDLYGGGSLRGGAVHANMAAPAGGGRRRTGLVDPDGPEPRVHSCRFDGAIVAGSATRRIEHPIVRAPMGGGPTTPELVAAVSNAGGLGSLAGAYLTPDQIARAIRRVRALTGKPFNVNLFSGGHEAGRQVDPAPMLALFAEVHAAYGLPPPILPVLPSDPTVIRRAFSGRPARGLVNAFIARFRQAGGRILRVSVIAISREIGTGVAEIAGIVAAELGADVLDRRIIDEIALRMQIPPEDAEKLDETAPSLIERLLNSMATANLDNGLAPAASEWMPPHSGDPSFDVRRASLRITEEVIRAAVRSGNVVIVGRGASIFLKDDPKVLSVRLRAPAAARAAILMKSQGIDATAAARRVKETDVNWSAYVRDTYHLDWRDPANYDLVLDTSRLGSQTAARIILAAASHFG